jgi:Fe-S-cluster containining protein
VDYYTLVREDYLRLLGSADAWFGRVLTEHREKMQCGRGCFDCCLGLFDITIADAAFLREGLDKLDATTRHTIEERSRALLARVPGLDGAATLEEVDDETIDAMSDAVGPERCVCLGDDGACLVYANRPLVCRLNGAPLVDLAERVVHAEGCFKNSITTVDVPRLDYAMIEKEERKVLQKLYKAGFKGVGEAYATMFIPQAVLMKA